MYKGVFIDDKVGEKRYADLLVSHSGGVLEIEFRQPELEVTELADQLIEQNFDFAALDFRLDEVPGVKKKNKYRASALAQHIRDRAIECPARDLPLILLSQEDVIENIFHADSTAEDLFDLVIAKGKLVNKSTLEPAATRISSMAAAYKAIKKELDQNKKVVFTSLLGMKSEEVETVLNQQAIRAIEKLKFPHQIISKLMTLLIQRPGILLSDEHLLARLAISPDSPNINQLKEKLDKLGMSYSGVLRDGWPRWWWHRIETWAKSGLGVSLGSLVGTERVTRLNNVLELDLKPAVSRWGNPP